MATFQQNLAKIRGEAIYGSDMRTAIAEAIEQADDQVQESISEYEASVEAVQAIIDDHLFYIQINRIEDTEDYIIDITEGEPTS